MNSRAHPDFDRIKRTSKRRTVAAAAAPIVVLVGLLKFEVNHRRGCGSVRFQQFPGGTASCVVRHTKENDLKLSSPPDPRDKEARMSISSLSVIRRQLAHSMPLTFISLGVALSIGWATILVWMLFCVLSAVM
jgi:hypothetical protein